MKRTEFVARVFCWFTLIFALPSNFSSSYVGASGVDSKSYDNIVRFLEEVHSQNPKSTELVEIGESDSGLKIVGIKVGSGPTSHLVVATHHGNEFGSTEVAQALVSTLAANPVPDSTVYIVPVLNISGYNRKQRRELAGGISYDPNRDYPGPCGTSGPFRLKSTQGLANFISEKNIVSSATLHTFMPGVLYPWGISTHDISTPYDTFFQWLGQQAALESHYQVGNSTVLLYPADGTFEDYAFWKHGVWSLLFELGYSHSPSESQIQEMIKVNVPGIIRMIAQAPKERAERHDFSGKCDVRLKALDLKNE